MSQLTKPSSTRLARRAGVKSLSDDCHPTIRAIIRSYLSRVVGTAVVVNSEHNTKTLMPDDVYEALRLLGYNVAQSQSLGTTTCSK